MSEPLVTGPVRRSGRTLAAAIALAVVGTLLAGCVVYPYPSRPYPSQVVVHERGAVWVPGRWVDAR